MTNSATAATPQFWELSKRETITFILVLLLAIPAVYFKSSTVVAVTLLVPLFVFFTYTPEAALAIMFNSTLGYFYLV